MLQSRSEEVYLGQVKVQAERNLTQLLPSRPVQLDLYRHTWTKQKPLQTVYTWAFDETGNTLIAMGPRKRAGKGPGDKTGWLNFLHVCTALELLGEKVFWVCCRVLMYIYMMRQWSWWKIPQQSKNFSALQSFVFETSKRTLLQMPSQETNTQISQTFFYSVFFFFFFALSTSCTATFCCCPFMQCISFKLKVCCSRKGAQRQKIQTSRFRIDRSRAFWDRHLPAWLSICHVLICLSLQHWQLSHVHFTGSIWQTSMLPSLAFVFSKQLRKWHVCPMFLFTNQ